MFRALLVLALTLICGSAGATSTNDITLNTNFFFDTLSLKATHGCP